MKHWGKVSIGLAVTVFALWWTLADVPFGELATNVRQGNLWLLGAAVVVTTFGFVIRAMRWGVLLTPIQPGVGLGNRFAAVAIHFMANNILWLRVGEFARAWVISRLEPVKASAAFGTVVVERFMDSVVLLVFLVVPVLSPGFPQVGTLSQGLGGVVFKGAIAVIFVLLAALVTMVVLPRQFVAVAERVAPVLPRPLRDPLLYSLGSFLESLAILRDRRVLVLGFLWSFGFWAFHALSFWLAMLAFGVDTGYLSALFTSSVVAFGVAPPAAPGFFGTFHFAAAFALSDVYGVSDPQALAFAFGFHFGGFVPITLIGLYYVARLGLSLGDVGAAEDRLERDEESSEVVVTES